MKNNLLMLKLYLLLLIFLFFNGINAQTITVDNGKEYQTIEGFGFFGAQDVWWHSSDLMWNEEWAEMAISDLGITIWRNEIFPPATSVRKQDADWEKQKPVVEGLQSVADEYGVDLKVILSVWSPPASMKWAAAFEWVGDKNATRNPDEDIQTNHGGTLNPSMYEDYANYLIDHIKGYEEMGISIYGISLQNEPAFSFSFNSCTYTTYWYCDLLNGVVPIIKKKYPEIKIFGSENMLEMEGRDKNWKWFYHNAIKNNVDAADNIDVLAVHGYQDGISPTTGSALVEMWTNHTGKFTKPLDKPAWMTETSGYSDSWEANESDPGALGLALDIHAALYYGNIQAWVWWQGSENPKSGKIGRNNLMAKTVVGKKYYVSKHFYRYIRPGAIRVDATLPHDDVFATAYKHPENNTQTLVIINSANENRKVSVEGENIPESFHTYRSSVTENCKDDGIYSTGADLILPKRSIVTLYADETSTGFNEHKLQNNIRVYPNPYKSGKLNITLNENLNSQIYVSFHLIDGTLLQKFNTITNNGNVSISPNLNQGIYLLKVETENIQIPNLLLVE